MVDGDFAVDDGRGLSGREAARRLQVQGPNVIRERAGRGPLAALLAQFTHPLALLLMLAAGLAAVASEFIIAAAIALVVIVNAVFALVQERQAERAVALLAAYLPDRARVVRDGALMEVAAADLVPGDLLVIEEGDRISADARLTEGDVSVDMSALTGESEPVHRRAGAEDGDRSPLSAPDRVFSGTHCVTGAARAVVLATGDHTEIGRIAALTARGGRPMSPLERQVRRVAVIIALVAVGVGALFLPLGVLAGLSVTESLAFAIGLIVANVPEGLLPTITLALALGVRALAARGALVRRLSAVETLGSTSVICTDKTGTLTWNRMTAVALWTPDGGAGGVDDIPAALADALAVAVDRDSPDPTTLALVPLAAGGSVEVTTPFRFDADLRRAGGVGRVDGRTVVGVVGAPESVAALCAAGPLGDGHPMPAAADELAARGLRVLAVAGRAVGAGEGVPTAQDDAERGLALLGLVGLHDPPRESVAPAMAECRAAGVRVLVVTGDNGWTAAAIAREVGLQVDPDAGVITGDALAAMTDAELDSALGDERLAVVARATPEEKLRIAESLQAHGHVVAMTGDGANDAPALRQADIGVAMGRDGTDVARAASAMVLVDDDFAAIVTAIRSGRQVWDNIRRFVLYIFAHAPAEVLPFLLFALSGGTIPLPITVIQLLLIDLGTETLPALALGREPAAPDVMRRAPRSRNTGVVDRRLLFRAWGVLGLTSAVLVIAAFLATLSVTGWDTDATTVTFAAIVCCQVGTALASRTDDGRFWTVPLRANPLLLWGIAFELALLLFLLYVPPVASGLGMAPLTWEWLMLAPMPAVVLAVDFAVGRLRARRAQARHVVG